MIGDVSLSDAEVHELASWNGKLARYMITIEEYKQRWPMAILQWRWNVTQRAKYLDMGGIPLPGGGYLILPEGVSFYDPDYTELVIPFYEGNPRDA